MFLRALATVVAISSLLLSGTFTPLPSRAANCSFVLGFQAIRDQIPDRVGDCLVDQHYNPENGDALQETTGGMLVWRKADNFTAFTDGYRSWVNGPYGLESRLNTERFPWEPQSSDESRGGPSAPSVAQGISDDCDVYKAILAPSPREQDGPPQLLVIYDPLPSIVGEALRLGSDSMLAFARASLGSDTDQSTFESFETQWRNLNKGCFDGTPYKAIFVSEEELDNVLRPEDQAWDAFYQKYPGANGLFQLSGVGLNERKDEALVYVGISQGQSAGAGGYLLLKKDGGNWKVVGGVTLWMS